MRRRTNKRTTPVFPNVAVYLGPTNSKNSAAVQPTRRRSRSNQLEALTHGPEPPSPRPAPPPSPRHTPHEASASPHTKPDLHHLATAHALLSSLSADTLLLSAGSLDKAPADLLYSIDPNLKMLDFHAHPLEPGKNRLAKPGHGTPVRTHDSRLRTPQEHSSHSNPPLSKH